MIAAVLDLQKGAHAAIEAVDELRRRLLDRHDVVDAHALGGTDTEIGIARTLELFAVSQHEIDFGHRGIGIRLGLGGAARDDDPGGRVGAARLADGLTRLAHGLPRHGAGVDDHGVAQTRLGCARADRLGFIGVEAAAESDDLAHARASSAPRSISPTKLSADGPVIRI